MGGLLLPAHGTIQCALGQICAAFYAVGHFNLAFPGQICYYKRADCPYLNRVWGLHCSFGIGVPVSLFDRFGAPTPGRFFICVRFGHGSMASLAGGESSCDCLGNGDMGRIVHVATRCLTVILCTAAGWDPDQFFRGFCLLHRCGSGDSGCFWGRR